jgi:peptidoglycan/LPS O-acetylase OafA/YrhL
MKYRAEIDGLRALAVIPVMLYHAGFKMFGGGYVGVDVFFVISGYLITTIILSELETGSFSLMRFYERRARRILPALYLVMFVCLPFAWFWLLPNAIEQFSKSLIAVSTFTSNILFWRTAGYFDTATELKPLIHTWSLAVEEQFYVLFPLFLMLTRKLSKRYILGLLVLAFILSLAGAQWLSATNSSFNFYMLPTRGWELLIGVFIAFYLAHRNLKQHNHNIEQLGSLLGLLLIVYSVFAYNDRTPFPSVYGLAPTLGAALIIIFATHKTIVGKLLSTKIFVAIGLISYSAYLWHQPIFAFARERSLYEPNLYIMSGLVLMSLILAYLSWKYVENPIRNGLKIERNKIFLSSVICALVFIGIGSTGVFTKGYLDRPQNSKLTSLSEIDLPKINNGWCFYSVDSIQELKLGANGLDCYVGKKSSKKVGILFGDSFAGQYEPLWDAVGKKESLTINAITTDWCHPTFTNEFVGPKSSRAYEQCLFNREYFSKNIEKYDFIILAGMWSEIYNQHRMDGVLALIALVAASGKPVIIMPSPKIFDNDIWRHYKKAILFNSEIDFRLIKIQETKDKGAISGNEILKDFSRKFPNVIYIDRGSIFNDKKNPSDLTVDGMPFTLEGNHISIYGSMRAAISFIETLEYATMVEAIKK